MTGPLFSQIALTPKTPIKTKAFKNIQNKLAYEWKNIFRELTKMSISRKDSEYGQQGINISDFE